MALLHCHEGFPWPVLSLTMNDPYRPAFLNSRIQDQAISLDVLCQTPTNLGTWKLSSPSSYQGNLQTSLQYDSFHPHHIHNSLLFLVPGRIPHNLISMCHEKHRTCSSLLKLRVESGRAGFCFVFWFGSFLTYSTPFVYSLYYRKTYFQM